MTIEENVRINSLEECKNYFIRMHRPNFIRHIEDFEGRAMHDYPEGRIGVLLKMDIKNAFEIDDNRYYYLVFRKDGWFNGWASENLANVPKYRNQPGCTISSRIYAHILAHPKYMALGAMTIGFGDGSYHYIRGTDFVRFVKRYGTEFESTRFPGQIDVGLAAEVTSTNDPLT